MTYEERAAYDAGADARANNRSFRDDFSSDWSVQREYENGFHARPRWY